MSGVVGHRSVLTSAVHAFPGPSWSGAPGCTRIRGEGRRLGVLVPAPRGQFPELIPEEHAEDGVGAQAQVAGAQTLVERQGALLLPDLHQAVGEAPIQLALGTDMGWASHAGPWLVQRALFVCKGLWGTSEKLLPPARKMALQVAKL